MQILAQGIVGLADGFIHPNYVSAVYPIEGYGLFGQDIMAIIALIAGFVLFAIAVHIFEKWWAKKKADERTGPSSKVRRTT